MPSQDAAPTTFPTIPAGVRVLSPSGEGPRVRVMARYYDVHPVDPQRRAITQVADVVRNGGLIAYPTDSCFALGCQLGNQDGIERIRAIRRLDDKHHFTLVCQDFAQLGQFVHISNVVFRSIKAATPGSYTFILPATKEVPRRLLHANLLMQRGYMVAVLSSHHPKIRLHLVQVWCKEFTRKI